MTGRERALRALNFEPADRVPMAAGWALHADFLIAASGEADFWNHPMDTTIRAWRKLGCDMCPQLILPDRREDFRGDVRRALEPLNEADIRKVWHCDGNVTAIVHRLLEAGIDGFQGFQQECGVALASFTRLKTRRGRKPIPWGSVSVTRTLPWGSVEDVKREVEQVCDILPPGGGFVLAPSSSICPEVPIENIFATFEHAKVYAAGRY